MDFRGESRLKSAIVNIAKKDQSTAVAVGDVIDVLLGEIGALTARVTILEEEKKKVQ